ncbi:predicted protein [Chaetoceros tenuissimus]|uniref:Uncharacterized protein n=1 Tax=Chaetoceros tenuissimus TaxID=426638 RepID=A0AAD3H9G6_9STRA|nr:predicted protein [Chaetoceros tenuissimus]
MLIFVYHKIILVRKADPSISSYYKAFVQLLTQPKDVPEVMFTNFGEVEAIENLQAQNNMEQEEEVIKISQPDENRDIVSAYDGISKCERMGSNYGGSAALSFVDLSSDPSLPDGFSSVDSAVIVGPNNDAQSVGLSLVDLSSGPSLPDGYSMDSSTLEGSKKMSDVLWSNTYLCVNGIMFIYFANTRELVESKIIDEYIGD